MLKLKLSIVLILMMSISAAYYYLEENTKGRLAPKISIENRTPHKDLAAKLIEKYGVSDKYLPIIESEIRLALSKDIPHELMREIYSEEFQNENRNQ